MDKMRGITLIGAMILFGALTIIGYCFSVISKIFKKNTSNRLSSEDIKRKKNINELNSLDYYKYQLESQTCLNVKVLRSSSISYCLPSKFIKNQTLKSTKLLKKGEFRLRSFSLDSSLY